MKNKLFKLSKQEQRILVGGYKEEDDHLRRAPYMPMGGATL